jgi:predicted ATPase
MSEILGKTIGPYRIVGLLGRGGVGSVYRAEDGRSGRLVALKTLERPLVAFLPTIRREISALAHLDHSGIVRILDSGAQGGVPWYAMELIEGPGLVEHCRGRPLAEALTCVRRLCGALAYLHGEGLVHRDLKPENILIRFERSEPGAGIELDEPATDGRSHIAHRSSLIAHCWPVLVDFGLAVSSAAAYSREALDTESGGSGTLLYMAPEQLRGELVDARADLYSLGCVLYELLTGHPPFQAASAAELAQSHLHEPPEPPSKHEPGLPQALDALVLRLLAKSPRERLGHADDVGAALSDFGAGDGAGGPPPRAYLYRPELAGRAELLQRLETRLERLESGRGGLVLLGGESGVGKSRLALELGRCAERRRLRVLSGECLSEGESGPLHPLRRPLQAIADRCRGRGLKETERLLGRHGKLLAPYEPALEGLPGQEAHPEPAELPAEAARLRLYEALVHTFSALAQDGPLLLLLDDLHWADGLTLGWLEHLADTQRLSRMPLLLVGTYRSEERSEPLERLLGDPGVEVLRLVRLEEEAVGQIVSDMLALSPPPGLFVRFLTRHSEGNPFFVAEYLRAAIAEGVLWRDSTGCWQVGSRTEGQPTEALYEALPLPRSLRETVSRRLDALSAEAQALAACAAVLGRELEEELLLQLAQLPEEQVWAPLEELRVREVLEGTGPGRLRFAHDKLREAAYEHVQPRDLARLHRRAAEALETRHAAGLQEDPAILGSHWEQAGVAERARGYYLLAARGARFRHAHRESERLYRAYLGLLQAPEPEAARALNELSRDILVLQGRCDEARECLRRARALATELRDAALEAQSLESLGNIELELGHTAQGQTLLEQALALWRDLGDRIAQAPVLVGLSVCHRNRGQFEVAQRLLQEALKIHQETEYRPGKERVLGSLGILHAVRGELAEAQRLFEQSLLLSQELGNRRAQLSALDNLANVLDLQDKTASAIQSCQQAIAIAREIGDRPGEAICLQNLGDLHMAQGVPDQALAIWDQTGTLFRSIGDRQHLAQIRIWQAALERRMGHFDAARRHLAELGGFVDALPSVPGVEYWCEQALLALAESRQESEYRSRAQELSVRLGLGSESTSGKLISRLQRAAEASRAGWPLFRGECWEDIPAGLRQWLIRNGRAGEPFVSLEARAAG